jgi:hypothetical protein
MEIEKEENPQVVNENKKSDSWKMIGLGSATGILNRMLYHQIQFLPLPLMTQNLM